MRHRRLSSCKKRLRRRCFRYSHIRRSTRCRGRAADRCRPKARCVDSESRFLARKKFFVLAGFASLRARQNRFFARIAAADSAAAILVSRDGLPLMVNDRCTRAGIKQGGDDADATSRDVQMPSLDLSRSFTACGLALPPDAFIAWPTNHAISCGFARACATLSGLAAMM